MILRFIHVSEYSSFFSIAKEYSTLFLPFHTATVHGGARSQTQLSEWTTKATKIPLNGCIIIWGCFQLLVMINKAPRDTHVKVYIFDLFVSHRPMAGLEWLHHVAGVCEIHILRNDWTVFQSDFPLFAFLLAPYESSSSSISLPALDTVSQSF